MSNTAIKLLILSIIGIGILAYYKIKNWYSKSSGKRVVNKLKNDPGYANELSDSLTFLYEKKKFVNESFIKRLETIHDDFQIGESNIVMFCKLGNDIYLFVTYFWDKDYNMTMTGKMGDIDSVHQFNYKLIIDRKESLLKIYSDYFYDREDKSLRETFIRRMFNYLLEQN